MGIDAREQRRGGRRCRPVPCSGVRLVDAGALLGLRSLRRGDAEPRRADRARGSETSYAIRDAATGHQVMSTVLRDLSIVGRPVWEGDGLGAGRRGGPTAAAGDRAGRRSTATLTRATPRGSAGRGHASASPRALTVVRGPRALPRLQPLRRRPRLGGNEGRTMPGPTDRPPTGAVAVADRNDARDADFAAYLAARQASLLRTAYLLTGQPPRRRGPHADGVREALPVVGQGA